MSDDRVHEAARGFHDAVDAYERGRPTYPPDAVAWLADRLGIGPRRRVLDLAAGTGKLTRLLVATGADVVSVEPIEEMRERLPWQALDGTAEAIPLADASVDAVTVAQAFHWFRVDEALAEIHRVLRPGGSVGLVWNTRDEGDELQCAITEILERLRHNAPQGPRAPRWREFEAEDALRRSPLFEDIEKFVTSQRQELTADGVIERFLSVSFVAAAAPAERDEVERAIARLLAGRAEPISLPYVTEVYVARRSEIGSGRSGDH